MNRIKNLSDNTKLFALMMATMGIAFLLGSVGTILYERTLVPIILICFLAAFVLAAGLQRLIPSSNSHSSRGGSFGSHLGHNLVHDFGIVFGTFVMSNYLWYLCCFLPFHLPFVCLLVSFFIRNKQHATQIFFLLDCPHHFWPGHNHHETQGKPGETWGTHLKLSWIMCIISGPPIWRISVPSPVYCATYSRVVKI